MFRSWLDRRFPRSDDDFDFQITTVEIYVQSDIVTWPLMVVFYLEPAIEYIQSREILFPALCFNLFDMTNKKLKNVSLRRV